LVLANYYFCGKLSASGFVSRLNFLPPSRPFPWREWIPALIWLGIIAVESTNLMSSAQTGRVLYSLATSIFGRLDPVVFGFIHAALRKVGHVLGYGILSFLLFRAWRATLRLPDATSWALRWSAVSFCMSLIVASVDELHQSYLPSRTGALHDVILDGAAALAVQFLLFALLWNREARARQHPARLV
jgi:VanZ family protein